MASGNSIAIVLMKCLTRFRVVITDSEMRAENSVCVLD